MASTLSPSLKTNLSNKLTENGMIMLITDSKIRLFALFPNFFFYVDDIDIDIDIVKCTYLIIYIYMFIYIYIYTHIYIYRYI